MSVRFRDDKIRQNWPIEETRLLIAITESYRASSSELLDKHLEKHLQRNTQHRYEHILELQLQQIRVYARSLAFCNINITLARCTASRHRACPKAKLHNEDRIVCRNVCYRTNAFICVNDLIRHTIEDTSMTTVHKRKVNP